VHYHEYDNCFSKSQFMHVHDGFLLSENVSSNTLYIHAVLTNVDYKTPVDLSGFISAYEYNIISDWQRTSIHRWLH